MKKLKLPILMYSLGEKAVLGFLVGTDIKAVEKDAAAVQLAIKTHLQKQYKKYDDYPPVELLQPTLKIVQVKYRPVYRSDTATYPVKQEIKISIPVIYGETPFGYHECFLPLFESSFYYHEKKQLQTLARYSIQQNLDKKTPEAVYRLLEYPNPVLEFVTIKINEDRDLFWGEWDWEVPLETLKRLADKYPPSRSRKKQQNNLPDVAWEMEAQVQQVTEKMNRLGASVLIAGQPGSGKSAVLKAAINKSLQQSKQSNSSQTFWRIMPHRIASSSKYLGEWQEAVEQLTKELKLVSGILWMENVVQLLQTGSQRPEASVAAYMMPFLRAGTLQMIGEVTPGALDAIRRYLPGFVENFHIVRLRDMPEATILKIMQQCADYIQQQQKVEITQEAIVLTYRLLRRFIPYQHFPGKGIQFLSQVTNSVLQSQQNIVNPEVVIQEFSQKTGLPAVFLKSDYPFDENDLKTFFHKQIIGQEKALEKLFEVVKIFKAALNNPHKPIATMLFAGPTGVGKTATAQALADYFFGMGQKKPPLIRIDMSEFQYSWQLGRLLGEQGQVGQLISAVREKPFAVVLLDEIEKADTSIYDALLTLLDEGKVTDSFGRETYFLNTIIIMTSNLGATNRRSIGYRESSAGEVLYMSAITRKFRPEFINRIDNILVFNPLGPDAIREIADKELKAVRHLEGLQKRNLNLKYSDKLKNHVIKTGFDERYGARPLQRKIENTIIHPLAQWLLTHPNTTNQTLELDLRSDNISIEISA